MFNLVGIRSDLANIGIFQMDENEQNLEKDALEAFLGRFSIYNFAIFIEDPIFNSLNEQKKQSSERLV